MDEYRWLMSNIELFRSMLAQYYLLFTKNDRDALVVTILRVGQTYQIETISFSNDAQDVKRRREIITKETPGIPKEDGVVLLPVLAKFRESVDTDVGIQLPYPFVFYGEEMMLFKMMVQAQPNGGLISELKRMINSGLTEDDRRIANDASNAFESGWTPKGCEQFKKFGNSERVDFENLIQDLD
jgi:hypothetical protein